MSYMDAAICAKCGEHYQIFETKDGGHTCMSSDDNIPIIGKPQGAPAVFNTDMLKASVPDLLGEIERRGVSLPQVSFQLIQDLCRHRSDRWNADNGVKFTIFERAAEVGGEVGELLNAVKKLRRHDIGMPGNYKAGEQDRDKLLEHAAYELGDCFVTLFNLAQTLNVDAFNCMQLAFNTKSREMGFPEEI